MANDLLKTFREIVNVTIIWNKTAKQIQLKIENPSDITFYFLQGELCFFNKSKRLVGGIPIIYKFLKPNETLSDNFSDMDVKIGDSVDTVVFRPYSVDSESPFVSTSLQEKSEEVNNKPAIIRVFDTDLVVLPENDD
jgi:hypothetical protein